MVARISFLSRFFRVATSVVYTSLQVAICAQSLFSMGCAAQIVVDDQGKDTDLPQNQVPDRSEQVNWMQDINLIGDTGIGVNGVDILVVVDNDPDMSLARMRLSSALYSLMTELLHPVGQAPVLSSIRVAVTTSDMGLQYGRQFLDSAADDPEPIWGDADAGLEEPSASGCDEYGDNGDFLPATGLLPAISLDGGQIKCEEYGGQCPSGWPCQMGYCTAPAAGNTVPCIGAEADHLETTVGASDSAFAAKAACMIHHSESECVVRQPLEAAVKSLSRNPSFLAKNHLLMVLILSGRDDCSIEDPNLFSSDYWTEERVRIACFLDRDAESQEYLYLYSIEDYYKKLLSFKNSNSAAVLFAAIVGAPELACNGTGVNAASKSCLTVDEMWNKWDEYIDEAGRGYFELFPACQFNAGDRLEDSPKPGRRLVALAMQFGEQGYVQSMCSAHWNSMVEHLVEMTQKRLSNGECRIDAPLWLDSNEATCPGCVISKCELYARFLGPEQSGEDNTCPNALVYGSDYRNRAGFITRNGQTAVFCPIREISVPVDCDEAESVVDDQAVGWYYCERKNGEENSESSCGDGLDNDGDDVIDCEQESCEDCYVCGNSTGCDLGCIYNVVLTPEAEKITGGQNLFLQCPGDVI